MVCWATILHCKECTSTGLETVWFNDMNVGMHHAPVAWLIVRPVNL